MNPLHVRLMRSLTLLLLGLLAMGLAAVLALSVRALAGAAAFSEAQRRWLVLLAAVVGVLLVFVISCLGLFAIRILTQRFAEQTEAKRGPTAYPDAWQIAGQRFELPDEEEEPEQPPPPSGQ